ncbi:CPBP family intramembrane glutamic endopeptidase [Lysobacter claricitrinus]|uniref:CPBP family intramembrane glutamic endopeptidase n=1 Tax=Lysobacter claricitrinus TaxID=3367728 RepID=UPI0037DB4AE1
MINPLFDPKHRLRNGWWALLFFVVLAAFVIPAQLWATPRGAQVPLPAQALMALFATAACTAMRREPMSAVFGRARGVPRNVTYGVVAGFALWSLTASMLWMTGCVRWSANPDAFAVIAPALLGCAATAITEELIFRGFVFQRLVDGLGAWPAQLLMGAYFVLNHWNNPGMTGVTRVIATVDIFAASLLFGLVRLRTRGLALPIALHFALNATQGVLLGFGVSGNASTGLLTPHLAGPTWWTGGAFGLEASLPGTAVIMLATIALARRRHRLVGMQTLDTSRLQRA